jgi:hypothetical protein
MTFIFPSHWKLIHIPQLILPNVRHFDPLRISTGFILQKKLIDSKKKSHILKAEDRYKLTLRNITAKNTIAIKFKTF